MALIALTVTFLTEVTSNTATTTLLMPILATAGISAGVDPIVLMLPAAVSASCAFMLPVATAPNAIVYGSGRVTTALMAREGVVLNLIGATIIALVFGSFIALESDARHPTVTPQSLIIGYKGACFHYAARRPLCPSRQ